MLVPVDGSEAGRRGLREAIALARSLDAAIRLVHVIDRLPWLSLEVTAPAVQELVERLQSDGESILNDSLDAVRAVGVAVDSRLVDAMGTAAGECVIEEAASWPADVIVCGTHGRRGVRRMLMGSDAEYILRHSPVPVLMVRSPGPTEHLSRESVTP
ncbi:MAG TPA: universal stress protein [Steroidobacteraceae bacterium]|nr:universal stress protein [Steroidobacteraceae bacterium]